MASTRELPYKDIVTCVYIKLFIKESVAMTFVSSIGCVIAATTRLLPNVSVVNITFCGIGITTQLMYYI